MNRILAQLLRAKLAQRSSMGNKNNNWELPLYKYCILYYYYYLFRHLNGKQNLRPKKGICSYLMKFYHAFDTVFAGYSVYWISNKFLRESFSSYFRGDTFKCVTLELGRLIIWFDHNS